MITREKLRQVRYSRRREVLEAQASLLARRLERLSADSYWAHQASGIRGSLLRQLEQPGEELEPLVRRGYQVLELAAEELLAKGSLSEA